MDKCPACKKRSINAVSHPKKSYNSKVINLLNKLCDDCQAIACNRLGATPTAKDIKELYAIVNGLLTSAEVRQIREKLNLTQKEAARICGGGPNAFSRYERGKAVPTRATSNLLRLLNRHPNEIEFLLSFNS